MKLISVTSVIVIMSMMPAAASANCASDANWSKTSRQIDELAQIAQCGKTFSQSECRSNLALTAGGVAATLGASVGASAAYRIRRRPKLCGIRGFSGSDFETSTKPFTVFLLEKFASTAHAATCADPAQEMARHVRNHFGQAADEIEDSVRKAGRAKLAAEHPRLTQIADEQISIQRTIASAKPDVKARDADSRRAWLEADNKRYRALQDEADQLMGRLKITNENGRVVRTTIPSFNNPEVAKMNAIFDDLIRSRDGALDPNGTERKHVVKSFVSRYPNEFSKSATSLKELSVLQTEINTKSVSPERLAAMLDSLAEKVPSHQLARLAYLRTELTQRFPKIPGAGAASRMAREGFKLLGKAGGGAFALATGAAAYASDRDSSRSLGDRVLTDFVGASSVGCAQVDSEWATVEGDGDCSYRPRWNAKTTDFALQPEEVQRRELTRHPKMCDVIAKVHAELLSSSIEVSCKDGGALIRDNRRRFSMDVSYDSKGLVKRAVVTGAGRRHEEYDMRFDGDQLELVRFPETSAFGNAGRSVDFDDPKFKTSEIRRGVASTKDSPTALLENAEEHFAMMQPQVHHAQACCSGGLDSSDTRCANLSKGSSTGKNPASGSGTNR